MSAAPRPLDRFAVLVMCGFCAGWGLNQVATKVALADIAPVTQSALRSGIGSIVLMLYAWRARPGVFRRDGQFWPGLVIGLLFAAEFIALFQSLQWTTASSAIVFVYTAPFFVGLGALALPGERLKPLQWIGMALAFLGVAIGIAHSSAGPPCSATLLALLAGALWGATTIVLKATRLRFLDPIKVLLYQTVTATFASTFYAMAIGELAGHVGLLPVLSLAYQSVFVVGFTYVIWFGLLTTYRAAELSAFTFATPILGVLAGWLLLGEPLSLAFLAAVALVAAGILIINWPARRPYGGRPRDRLGIGRQKTLGVDFQRDLGIGRAGGVRPPVGDRHAARQFAHRLDVDMDERATHEIRLDRDADRERVVHDERARPAALLH